MPQLPFQRVKELFRALVEPPPEDKPPTSPAAAAVDPALSQRLHAIAEVAGPGSGLASPVLDSLLWETSRSVEPVAGREAPAPQRTTRSENEPPRREASERTPLKFAPLEMLGRYCIVGKIGEGGMGEVWRAIDTSLDREVAIKFLPGHWLHDAARLQSFRREARLLASLNHPHIVTLHAVEEEKNLLFLVLEMLRGSSLRQHIPLSGMPISQLLDHAIPIADALTVAHARGITHHDLKPENVMVTEDGWTKVLDFGLAARQGSRATTTLALEETSETVARIAGTIPYMSPESLRGQSAGPPSDVFSFGVLLFELAVGRRPFVGESTLEIVQAILHEPTPSLAQHGDEVPVELDALVSLCLDKDPSRRPATAQPVLDGLRHLRRERERGALRHLTGIRSDVPSRPRPPGTVSMPTLAIMPFQDLSPASDLGYLCAGVAEEIATSLSRQRRVRVSAVSRIDRGTIEPVEMARLLGTGAYLDGSVARVGDRVRLTVRLGDTSDGTSIWSERFERAVDTAFDIQDEVAKAVSTALQVRLQSSDTVPRVHDPAAYAAYMKGRFFWGQRYEGGLRRALECFRESLALDPTLAAAHSGLADCFMVLGHYGVIEPQAAYAQGRDAAQRALEIDPLNAEAHASMGWVTGVFEWDWARSDDWFERSTHLDPRYATGWLWKGITLMSRARREEALYALRQAQRIDPLSLMISSILAWNLHVAGDDEQAESMLATVLEMDPRFVFAHSVLSKLHASHGDLEQATLLAERGAGLSAREGLSLGILGWVYAVGGRTADAEAILRELETRAAERYVSFFHRALVSLGLGRIDDALADLTRSVESRDSFFCTMHFDPVFDSLRLMPQFHVLLEKMNLLPGMDERTLTS